MDIETKARQLAKQSVKRELRRKGFKTGQIKAADLDRLATDLFWTKATYYRGRAKKILQSLQS